LSYNQISNVTDFDVKNLSELHLTDNQIFDINNFDVKNLNILCLKRNKISDVTDFDVKNLSELNLIFNKISDSDINDFDQKYLTTLTPYKLKDQNKRNREMYFTFLFCLNIKGYSKSIYQSMHS